MSNIKYFEYQFIDIDPVKLARRQRFIRRMQNKVHHRIDKRQLSKLLKRRITKVNLL
jgi:hypothetical protein